MKKVSLISGAAVLAEVGAASAGPMTAASSLVVTPPIQTEQIHYRYRHHYRHYGWHRGWHYGWRHHRYYGWNPATAYAGTALGWGTLPFALATGGWPYHGYPYYYYRTLT